MSPIRSTTSSTQMLTLMNAAIKSGSPAATPQQPVVESSPLFSAQKAATSSPLTSQLASQAAPQSTLRQLQGDSKADDKKDAKKEKKGGKPAHAGGPFSAAALPPGLQGKELPVNNPWREAAARIQAEQEAAAKQQETGQSMLSAFKVKI